MRNTLDNSNLDTLGTCCARVQGLAKFEAETSVVELNPKL